MCETLSANDEAWTLRPLDVQWPSLGTCPSTLWVVCGSSKQYICTFSSQKRTILPNVEENIP